MIIISNRGPFRFVRDGSGFDVRPGAGGLASALGPLVVGAPNTVWIASALGDDDRAAVRAGAAEAPGVDLQLLDVDPGLARLHYDVVSNGVLWFLHHGIFDLPRRPRFDARFHEAWAGYVGVNRMFATRAAELAPDGDAVLVQDYHVGLVPGMLRAMRPDVKVLHFTHTPFCGPSSIRVLPDRVAAELCTSMASVPCGFHTQRWADAYAASLRTVLGADAPIEPTFVAPLGPDPDALASALELPETRVAGDDLDELVGDRQLVLRSDRIDPSKNLVRGFATYDLLLEQRPEWRERVVFVAMFNPSRESLPEYLAYRTETEQAAARVNDRWSTRGWDPVVLDTRDDYARSVAGLARYDVLVVNPLRDGLNLVAKEGPLVNRRAGVLCLSPEAGAYDELHEAALRMHPYDLDQAAGALHAALSMPADERARRAERLRALSRAHHPGTWLAAQLDALGARDPGRS